MGLRAELFDFLVALPASDSPEERRSLITHCGGGDLARKLVFEGSNDAFWNGLLYFFGQGENLALVDFLQKIGNTQGVGVDLQHTLATLRSRVKALDAATWRREFFPISERVGPASIGATTLRLLFALIALVVVVAVCTTAVAMLSDRPKSGYPQGVKLTVSPSHEDATYPFGLPLTITAKLGDQPVRVLVWSDPQYGTITVNDASSITYIGSRLGIEQITVRTELGEATESISIREPAIYIKGH